MYYEKIYTNYSITFCCHQSPGSVICSAYNIYDKYYFDSEGGYLPENQTDLTESTTLFGRNHYYGIQEGTSMSAPHVAGIIALWLQARYDLCRCAHADSADQL